MRNIVLFGPPGSGKGTQAAKLTEKYNLVHISTGDILRQERKNETPLGKEAQKFIEQGMLVPDELVIGMLSGHMDHHLSQDYFSGFIFDGFPRTVPQAEALDKLMTLKHLNLDLVLFLKVDAAELEKRLLNRGKDSGRKDDQDIDIIRNRFKVYQNETEPVSAYYDAQDKVKRLEGTGTIDSIFNRLCEVIDNNTTGQ